MWATVLIAVCLIFAIVGFASERAARRSVEANAKYWRQQYLSRSMDLDVFAFENRDMILEWEGTHPHVRGMPARQKLAEWLTICANAEGDRERLASMIVDSGAYHRTQKGE